MTPEYTNQVTVELLLLSFMTVLALGILACVSLVLVLRARRCARSIASRESVAASVKVSPPAPYRACFLEEVGRWMVIRTNRTAALQEALCLRNPRPCSWPEGIARSGARCLFISPQINGWILVTGQALPDPADDVDKCFHFLTRISRELGQVQFYSVHRALNHHAWIRLHAGRVIRAYAWAGETLWNQGPLTPAESGLHLNCLEYGEHPDVLQSSSSPVTTTDQVLLLAARWSFDPTSVSETQVRQGLGVTGDVLGPRSK